MISGLEANVAELVAVKDVQQVALFDVQVAHASLTREAVAQREELFEREARQLVTEARLDEMLEQCDEQTAERDEAFGEVLRLEASQRAAKKSYAELESAHEELSAMLEEQLAERDQAYTELLASTERARAEACLLYTSPSPRDS